MISDCRSRSDAGGGIEALAVSGTIEAEGDGISLRSAPRARLMRCGVVLCCGARTGVPQGYARRGARQGGGAQGSQPLDLQIRLNSATDRVRCVVASPRRTMLSIWMQTRSRAVNEGH